MTAWQSATSSTAGDGDSTGIFQQIFGAPADFTTNAAPEIGGFNTSVDYIEQDLNAAPRLLDANSSVALSDADSSDFDGGNLLITRLNIPKPLINQLNAPDDLSQDQIGVRHEGNSAGQIGVSGTTISYGGVAIGTMVSNGVDGSALQIDFNASADTEAVERLLENITYRNISDDPLLSHALRIQMTDGDGGSSEPQIVTVNIAPTPDGAIRFFGERQANSYTTSTQDAPAMGHYGLRRFLSWCGNLRGRIPVQRAFTASDSMLMDRRWEQSFWSIPRLPVPSMSPRLRRYRTAVLFVTWDNNSNIYFQRYDSAGVAQGPETQANALVASTQFQSSVAGLADGTFVVAWTAWASGSVGDGSGYGVVARHFDAAGNPLGDAFNVNTENFGLSATAFSDSTERRWFRDCMGFRHQWHGRRRQRHRRIRSTL